MSGWSRISAFDFRGDAEPKRNIGAPDCVDRCLFKLCGFWAIQENKRVGNWSPQVLRSRQREQWQKRRSTGTPVRKLKNLISGLFLNESEAKRDHGCSWLGRKHRRVGVAVDKVLPTQQHALTLITCSGRPEVPNRLYWFSTWGPIGLKSRHWFDETLTLRLWETNHFQGYLSWWQSFIPGLCRTQVSYWYQKLLSVSSVLLPEESLLLALWNSKAFV